MIHQCWESIVIHPKTIINNQMNFCYGICSNYEINSKQTCSIPFFLPRTPYKVGFMRRYFFFVYDGAKLSRMAFFSPEIIMLPNTTPTCLKCRKSLLLNINAENESLALRKRISINQINLTNKSQAHL